MNDDDLFRRMLHGERPEPDPPAAPRRPPLGTQGVAGSAIPAAVSDGDALLRAHVLDPDRHIGWNRLDVG